LNPQILSRVAGRQTGANTIVSSREFRPGDAAAFERLFRTHYEALCRFAVRYVGDGATAEELVQDLFTQLWVDRDRWPEPQNVRAYLFTAVRNRALNVGQRRQVEADWVAAETITASHATDADDEPSRFESDESRNSLQRAIEELPERCRLVMHLRWRDQMSHADIARIMGISVKGVEAQLARGLRSLRAAFGVLRRP
jgi:RNA polymerase sigma-70 factor (ECF subfamily)